MTPISCIAVKLKLPEIVSQLCALAKTITFSSKAFIHFMLNVLNEALEPYLNQKEITLKAKDRIQILIQQINTEFTRSDYLKYFKSISSPTASRDLASAVKLKLIEKLGDKRNTKYNKETK